MKCIKKSVYYLLFLVLITSNIFRCEIAHSDADKFGDDIKNRSHQPISYAVSSAEATEALNHKNETIKKKLDAIQQDPHNIVERIGLAQWYMVWGKQREALEQYQACIKIDPSYAVLYRGAAIIKSFLGDYAGALTDLQKAVQIEPSNSLMHEQLGDVYFMNKKYELGISEYSRAKALGANDPTALEKKMERLSYWLSPNQKNRAILSMKGIVIKEGLVTGYDFVIKDQ